MFVATAEERSISAAARRLGASASSVSQQLSNLEVAVGTLLLNRRERPVTLTPAGEMFRKRAYTILNETAEAKADLAKLDPTALTQLRLGMIEDFDASVSPTLLAHLATEMRSTQFLLETGASHRLYDLLDTRGLDLIVAADMGAAADWMEIHPVLSEPFVAVVPKGGITGGELAGATQGDATDPIYQTAPYGPGSGRPSGTAESDAGASLRTGQLPRDHGDGRKRCGLDNPDAAGCDGGAQVSRSGRCIAVTLRTVVSDNFAVGPARCAG